MSIPFIAYFNILTAGASDEIISADGRVTSARRMSLSLEADPHTQIVLSTGERLSATEVCITLVTPTEFAKFSADADLSPSEVGYLIHTEHGVHGTILWPHESLPYYLLSPGLKTTVSITFSSLAAIGETAAPYRWQQGRERLLRIASFGMGCAQEQIQSSSERNV